MNKNSDKTTKQSQPTPQLQSLSLVELETVAGGPDEPMCPDCLVSN